MTNVLLDIADVADELTDPRQNVERLQTQRGNSRVRRMWIVTLPSLLDQLATAVIPGESYADGDEVGRSSFESRPAARLDAVDRLLAIEAGAKSWCREVGIPARATPASTIRALVGAAATFGSDAQAELLRDLRAWRTWAATVTGWERPPDAPRAPCPQCEAVSTLRVRLERKTGCCLACGAAWDEDNIGVLAQHIRSYAIKTRNTNELRTAAVLARRAEDRRRRGGGDRRPDLPYLPQV